MVNGRASDAHHVQNISYICYITEIRLVHNMKELDGRLSGPNQL